MKRLLLLLVVIIVFAGVTYEARSLNQQRLDRDSAAQAVKRTDISVTIVEGKRREEIATQLEKAGVTSRADFLALTTTDEGKLFPDTYRFFPNTPAADVVAKLEANYTARTEALAPTQDQLILASIIEREASNDTERPIIAAVYTNRLDIGMKLQSDPTVQYAKDTLAYTADPTSSFTFWKPITQADYTSAVSQFNTYVTSALPPAPICNPGLASIKAAINPASGEDGYLYFIEKNGQLLLAKTLAQHNAQAAQ